MSHILCPRDGAAMTNFQRSGVPMRICPTCEATLLPAGGLDQIMARERQAGPPTYQQNYGNKHGRWGGHH